MKFIEDIAGLETHYPEAPAPRSLAKVRDHLTPAYMRWIAASRFCIVATVGPGGTDASPRGDDGPVVRPLDPRHLAMPDWSGNNRLDSLRNIVSDGRVSLMFLVAGSENVVRVNGTARLTADAELARAFQRPDGKLPRTVVVVEVAEVYFQCAKALIRSALWSGAAVPEGLPTAGDFVRETDPSFDGDGYDRGYPEYARPRLW
ncbi:pyridoxamine 5'-phosphate oxidase family protein [Rhodobacterales bacterium HKCCE2091]|nr:pyridoxamine 5'-phosphate oxidase family protein [Rhodobacterales bacterium HKCCE2091]